MKREASATSKALTTPLQAHCRNQVAEIHSGEGIPAAGQHNYKGQALALSPVATNGFVPEDGASCAAFKAAPASIFSSATRAPWVTCRVHSLLPFVFSFAEFFVDAEPGLLGVGDG